MRQRFRALLLAPAAWVTLVVAVPGAPPAGTAARSEVVTYEVRGRDNGSDLGAFAAAAAAVYADPRGWSLGGSLRFERVESGGQFTLWLAADDRMRSFGGACEWRWSCRNRRHVVINEARWLGGTESWRATGASLTAYRTMVLNHETGHWLGFPHAGCPRAGAPAPVMQQQSIRLGGCDPNPWPLLTEQAALAARRGVPLVQVSGVADPARPDPPAPSGTYGLETACLRQALPLTLRRWIACF